MYCIKEVKSIFYVQELTLLLLFSFYHTGESIEQPSMLAANLLVRGALHLSQDAQEINTAALKSPQTVQIDEQIASAVPSSFVTP